MSRRIHLLHQFADPCGGGELELLAHYDLLRQKRPDWDVQLWTEYEPHPELLQSWPIQTIKQWAGQYPKDGLIVFSGVYRNGLWYWLAKPMRVALIFTISRLSHLHRRLPALGRFGKPAPEVVFVSRQQQQRADMAGEVFHSLIDPAVFQPRVLRQSPMDTFTVGRLSRDVAFKHGEQDPQLYRQLLAQGIELSLRGADCLQSELADVQDQVQWLPASSEGVAAWLQQLDCFYYRTASHWLEAFGRVVAEAMACGLPVVVERRGGYVDLIEHGVNGLLFDTTEQALAQIMRLRADPALAQRLGQAARRTIERTYGDAYKRRLLAFYAGDSASASE